MKKIFWILIFSVSLFFLMSGCRIVKVEEEKTPVSYVIVEKEELPQQLKDLIEEKKKKEFQITYQTGEDFYLIKGYGQQMSGGYSIQVQGLESSENALFFYTMLIGPDREDQNSVPSYPYVVVKTACQKGAVVFKQGKGE